MGFRPSNDIQRPASERPKPPSGLSSRIRSLLGASLLHLAAKTLYRTWRSSLLLRGLTFERSLDNTKGSRMIRQSQQPQSFAGCVTRLVFWAQDILKRRCVRILLMLWGISLRRGMARSWMTSPPGEGCASASESTPPRRRAWKPRRR